MLSFDPAGKNKYFQNIKLNMNQRWRYILLSGYQPGFILLIYLLPDPGKISYSTNILLKSYSVLIFFSKMSLFHKVLIYVK